MDLFILILVLFIYLITSGGCTTILEKFSLIQNKNTGFHIASNDNRLFRTKGQKLLQRLYSTPIVNKSNKFYKNKSEKYNEMGLKCYYNGTPIDTSNFPNLRQYITHSNRNVYNDEFEPPNRYNNFIQPIYTRGYPEEFQLVGILTDTTNTIYNLFGRQRYRGSNIYDYYLLGSNNNMNFKIPIDRKKEILDKESIVIPELNNKTFIASIYDYNLKYYA